MPHRDVMGARQEVQIGLLAIVRAPKEVGAEGEHLALVALLEEAGGVESRLGRKRLVFLLQ